MINQNERAEIDDDGYYDLDEAADVVWDNLPAYLKEKYSFEEIYFILEAEFDYLDSIGIMLDEDAEPRICDYPRDIDQPKMEKTIVDAAIKNGILLSYDELGDIIDTEMIYYEMKGMLGDASEYLN